MLKALYNVLSPSIPFNQMLLPQSSTVSILPSDSAITYVQWTRTDKQIMAYIMRSINIPIWLSINRLTSSRD